MQADIPQLRAELDGFESRMRDRNTPFARHLRPGLPDDEIDVLTASLPFRVPDEMRAFYAWHDGVTELDDPEWPFFPGGDILYPLTECVEDYHEWVAGPRHADGPYLPTWFPINSMDGIAVVLDCDVPPGGAGPIHKVDYHAEWRYNCAPSLLQVVRLWSRMLDEGYWVYDAAEADWDDHFAEIPLELRLTGLV